MSRLKGLPPRLYRLTVLVAIVWLVHANHQWHRAQRGSAISLEEITRFFPDAAELGPREPPYMLQAVSDNNGERLGLVLHTSPEADHIRGYSGPTDVIVAMDPTGRVTGAGILSSEDTRDHVEEVIRDTDFWDAFEGLALGAPGLPGIDAVSGSTLAASLTLLETQNITYEPWAAALYPFMDIPALVTAIVLAGIYTSKKKRAAAEALGEEEYLGAQGGVSGFTTSTTTSSISTAPIA